MVLSSICGDKGKRAQTYIVHVFYICIALFYRIYITLIKKKKKKKHARYMFVRVWNLWIIIFFIQTFFFFLICWKLSTMLLHRKKKSELKKNLSK